MEGDSVDFFRMTIPTKGLQMSRLRSVALVVVLGCVFGSSIGASPLSARASVQVTGAPFAIRYGVATSTRFTVLGDGKVTVTSRATGPGYYTLQVRRENCGSFGCHGHRLVGNRVSLPADGRERTVTLTPGNSTRNNQIWIAKPDDGRLVQGTISFR